MFDHNKAKDKTPAQTAAITMIHTFLFFSFIFKILPKNILSFHSIIKDVEIFLFSTKSEKKGKEWADFFCPLFF